MASLGGFKALAYAAEDLTNPVAPYQCSLVFRCDNVAQRATVLLVCEVPTREAAHSFVLQYDADVLQPSPGGLDSDNSYVPKAQLDDLLRAKDSRKSAAIKTLVLRFAQPCPLWSPGSCVFAAASGSEPPFADFVHLARATTVHIVFDYKYVPKQHASMMRSFSKGKGLLGFPVDRLLADLGLRKTSWDVFGPADAAGAPPAYANPRKRARQPSSTSPRQSPKRVPPQSPTESHASDKTVPLSPATTEAIQNALRKGAPAFDYQTEAIDAAVARQLSLYLDKTLPATLRDSLSALFTSAASRSTHNSPHPSSPPRNSTSSAPSLYSSSPPPPPPELPTLTPVARTLLPHLTAHLTSQFSAQQAALLARFTHNLNAMADSAAYDRTHETEAMLEDVEDMRAEMSVLRDDAVGEMQRGVSDVMERGSKEIDELEERIEEVYREAEGRIEEVRVWFEGLKAGVYGLVRMETRREATRLMRRKREVRRGVGKKAGRAEMRLLGRRREAEEVEWVDV